MLHCPECHGWFAEKNMRLVKDVYYCESCREARRKKK